MTTTWDELALLTQTPIGNLSNENMTANPAASLVSIYATIGVTSGKWYWELQTSSDYNGSYIGIAAPQHTQNSYVGGSIYSLAWHGGGYITSNATNRIYAGIGLINTRARVAFDADELKIWFGTEAAWILGGDPESGTNPSATSAWFRGSLFFPACTIGGFGENCTIYPDTADFINPAPTGFLPLPEVSAWPGLTGTAIAILPQRDIVNGGSNSIAGKVTEFRVPGSYRVCLFDQKTKKQIRETWSDAEGNYSFTNLDTKPKFIITFDHTSPVQTMVGQDNVVPS